jgi:aldehyde:ferredoxin oxidoreductase
VPLANEAKARELQRHYFKNPAPEGSYPTLHAYGTVGITADSAMSGDSPVKNWGGAGPTDVPQIRETFRDKTVMTWERRKYPCWRCNIGCGGWMEVKEGMYAGTEGHKVEYETACAFGTMALNDDFPSCVKANEIVNRLGLDSISAPAAVVFAIECYENGILTDKETGGLKLKWGNHVAMNQLLEQIGKREGWLGDILADGVKRAAEKIGKGAEKYAIHVQGQEAPMHDPRFTPGLALTYKMDSTPARHTQGGELIPPMGIKLPGSELPKYQASGKAQMHKAQMELVHVLNATGGCLFAYISYPVTYMHEFLTAITGIDYTLEDMYTIGERIGNIRHAFNLREGLNPLKFELHGRLTGNPPLAEGNLKGVTIDVDTMVREYCNAFDWDTRTAKPSARRLKELGLDFLVKDVAR